MTHCAWQKIARCGEHGTTVAWQEQSNVDAMPIVPIRRLVGQYDGEDVLPRAGVPDEGGGIKGRTGNLIARTNQHPIRTR